MAACLIHGGAAEAQADSSGHRFALFSGAISTGDLTAQLGASVSFHVGDLRLPLRASLQAGREGANKYHDAVSSGTLSLDVVAHPVASVGGLYLLGGAGVFSQAGYTAYGDRLVATPNGGMMLPFADPVARRSWGFLAGGVGIEVRRAFVESKLAPPFTVNGRPMLLLSAGVRL